MGFRRRAGGGRRDSNERDIIDVMEAIGARVYPIGGTGNPDLAIWFRGRPYLCEVKTAKGKRTDNQTDIPWPIVRDYVDAFAVIGVMR